MKASVVDSNVPIVANGKAQQASPQCILACINALDEARRGLVSLDDGFRIIQEYMNNLSISGQPGAGDAFVKWVFDNQANDAHCERVPITPLNGNGESYAEFPIDADLVAFDWSDRKFVAVALASKNSPPIFNATDSDWWHAREALGRNGVTIRFVCDDQFGS